MANIPSSHGPRLAPELIDTIIDYNHADTQTLASCALVAKEWVPSTRYHLFSNVEISHENAREFIDLLESPQCTFAAAVKGLAINFVPGAQRWFSELSRCLFDNGQVHITSIRVQGTTNTNTVIRQEVFNALQTYFNDIRTLEFGPVIIDSFAQFSTFLCSFPALETLSCSSIFKVNDQSPDTQFRAPLRRVHLESPSMIVVLEFLLKHGVLPSIITLSLSYITRRSYNTLSQYLAIRNDCLENLTITLNVNFSGASMEDFMGAVDLSSLHVLRDLQITTNPSMTPNQAYELLARISSVHLRQLEISVGLVQGIARLDIFLASERFASLKKIRIVGSDWANIRQALPRCDMKNMLEQS
ncbi:hypothetical protein CPC08DRAFT_162566 [Agrocybe pediades]|nr:hypothetical protein CPC08DRAFT_162566 [Agrocybe pediades]